jgi:hypothetical protein
MRQMIFYAMTEAETFDPAISTRSLADLKSKGFDSIYFEYRNTRAPHSSPRFRAAVKHICAKAPELTGGEPVARWNGKVIGVRQGNVTTVTTELPQFPGALSALWPVEPVALPGLFAFPYTRGKQRLLALCARHAQPVSGEFVWEGTKIECRNSRHGVLRRDEAGKVTVWLA